MKLLNQPIKVMAIFHEDGKIEPVKFSLDDKVVRIQKIIKVYEEKAIMNRRIIFVCQHNNRAIYELKYELESKTWYLYKTELPL